ncbi:WYL domain-containing protein [Paenibacillus solani]|uniref:WYL domain-containing protein n=1 Tax=Paenibacillus solani TaxID=1705565 RepID=UPI003D2CD6CA
MSQNPFEKIFNYQIMTRLEETDSIAITTQERGWLKMMLVHPETANAFTPETLKRLEQILHMEHSNAEMKGIILEKAKGQERSVYHPHLRTLRRMIMNDQGFRLSYRTKIGEVRSNQSGFPFKLEYSMIKREWMLIWYSRKRRWLMYTKLDHILYIQGTSLPSFRIDHIKGRLQNLIEHRQKHALIEIDRRYNGELSRILYAFSCFDKTVDYDEDSNTYRIKVCYLEDECDFLLSRIRFLGLRVKVVEGSTLQARMQETAAIALARYTQNEDER